MKFPCMGFSFICQLASKTGFELWPSSIGAGVLVSSELSPTPPPADAKPEPRSSRGKGTQSIANANADDNGETATAGDAAGAGAASCAWPWVRAGGCLTGRRAAGWAKGVRSPANPQSRIDRSRADPAYR